MADGSPVDSHLDEAMWERLACHELTPFERERALVHVTSCKACTAIHRALLALEEDARAFDPGVPASGGVPAGAIPNGWPKWILGAALAAAIVVAAVLRPVPPPRPRDAMRAGSAATTMTLLTPADGGALSTAGFSWSPVPDADAYRVQVSAADGRVIWESPLVNAGAAQLPAGVTMRPGTYFWHVTASRAGEPLATSRLSRFLVDK